MLTLMSLPITLVTGSEEVLVRQALEDARSQAREREGADPDRRTVSAADEDAAATLAEALGPTLFDEPALVIVTDRLVEGVDRRWRRGAASTTHLCR